MPRGPRDGLVGALELHDDRNLDLRGADEVDVDPDVGQRLEERRRDAAVRLIPTPTTEKLRDPLLHRHRPAPEGLEHGLEHPDGEGRSACGTVKVRFATPCGPRSGRSCRHSRWRPPGRGRPRGGSRFVGDAADGDLAWSLSRDAAHDEPVPCRRLLLSRVFPGYGLKDERTSKTTPWFFANSTERDCITLEPAEASSSISSYEISSSFRADFTTRGSAVYNAVDVRVDLAPVGLDRRGERHGGQVRAPAPEGRDVPLLVDALEARHDDDAAFLQVLHDRLRVGPS